MVQRKSIGKEQALQKLRHYCAYQERSHFEAREKLYGYGLRKAEVEECLATLIEENYLNEERFACQFALGKFRMKQWGRVRIKQALQLKRVSTYNITHALGQIDEEVYRQTALKVAQKKFASLKKHTLYIRRLQTLQYLLSRGFEKNVASAAIEQVEPYI